MIFVELRYLGFLLLVLLVYWPLRSNTKRKMWLLGCSYLFYAAWDWRFLSLILLSSAVDFELGRRMPVAKSAWAKRALLLSSMSVNLGMLGFFKYCNFFIESAAAFSGWLGLGVQLSTLNIILPVGISFYTFQTMSYTLDIYRGQFEPVESRLDFFLFVGFFPQLVAGPIVRARELLPQFDVARVFGDVKMRAMLVLFLVGFFKKACISDTVAPFVDTYFDHPEAYAYGSAYLATILYGIQVYCDFSGYSDMAIASAGFLGYDFPLNFYFPYFSTNPTALWQRWHITLYSWLNDYLYRPLSLSMRHLGLFGMIVAVMVTFALSGLWHGAGWPFVMWGVIHGIGISIEIITKRRRKKLRKKLGKLMPTWLYRGLGLAYVYLLLLIADATFRSTDMAMAGDVLLAMLTFDDGGGATLGTTPWVIAAGLAGLHWLAYREVFDRLWQKLGDHQFALAYGAVVAVTMALRNTAYQPFVYFQF